MSIKSNLALVVITAFILQPVFAHSQDTPPPDPDPLIDTAPVDQTDAEIAARISEIFNEIASLQNVTASVEAGVVTLSGTTVTADAAARAEALATRVYGVVTVENQIERDVSVTTRVAPALDEAESYVADVVRFLPLLLLGIFVFALIVAFGWLISAWGGLWRRIAPNAFIAELARTTIRIVFVALGAIAALSLLDATALLGAFLGAAGVIGLAVGFAVRDTIENYIASVMLSLRQPFRPNDHVVIDIHEGHVIRLTSRATILMTPQGNHLRIPNSFVFKAVILNYTRNSERRFEFELGIDADDDPIAAIETGLAAITALDFVLKEPKPIAFIKNVGDSNIVIFFAAWVDQAAADFHKSRSAALSAAKKALEEAGFALPEPIYRLRFDANAPPILKQSDDATITRSPQGEMASQRPKRSNIAETAVDVSPAEDIARKVEEERREDAESDLLTHQAPTE